MFLFLIKPYAEQRDVNAEKKTAKLHNRLFTDTYQIINLLVFREGSQRKVTILLLIIYFLIKRK